MYASTNGAKVAASLEMMNKTTEAAKLRKQSTFVYHALRTEGNLKVETAQEIMQKKGSKCKCPKEYSLSGLERKPCCGDFCKYLSGKQ